MAAQAPKIAVIGGGPMGLGVAYELVKQGYHPVVFEADDRLGGMTACFDFDGQNIERFYHFHCTSDTAFFQLLDELGLSQKLKWTETKMGYWYQGELQAWGNPVSLLRFRGLSLVAKIRYGLFAFYCTKLKDWRRIDSLEATDWIKKWVGREAYEALWEKLFAYKFYHYSDQLSASWIWARIRRIGQSRHSLFKEKLGYVEGGSNVLLNALSEFLENNGAQIRLSAPIKNIVVNAGAVEGLQLESGFEPFDTVISTVPLPFIPMLVPDLPNHRLEQYKALKNVAVVCVILKLKEKLSDNFWININDADMDIPGLVEYSNLQATDNAIVYVPFYMPGDHEKFQEPDEAFLEKCKRYIKTINPNLADSDVIAERVSRYRWAQPVCGPNFLDELPPAQSEVRGLWIADTSHYYPEDRGISESIGYGRKIAVSVLRHRNYINDGSPHNE